MNIKKVKKFTGEIFLGLNKGYTEEKIKSKKVVKTIQAYQNDLITNKDIYLSAYLNVILF